VPLRLPLLTLRTGGRHISNRAKGIGHEGAEIGLVHSGCLHLNLLHRIELHKMPYLAHNAVPTVLNPKRSQGTQTDLKLL